MFPKIYNDFNSTTKIDVDNEAIKNSIRNILLTPIGTMPGKPTFGSNLYKVLFEIIDHITIELIRTYVVDALAKWEPRIQVSQVDVKDYPEYNKIIVDISYYYIYYDTKRDDKISLTIFQ